MKHLLLFRLAQTPYALDIEQIREIVESPPLHYIPRAPAPYLGAINVHGSVLPVLDLVAHLGFEDEERDHRLIVLPAEICALALSVSAVGRIVPCDPQTHLPPLERRGSDSFGTAQFERDGALVSLFDLPRLVASLTSL